MGKQSCTTVLAGKLMEGGFAAYPSGFYLRTVEEVSKAKEVQLPRCGSHGAAVNSSSVSALHDGLHVHNPL